MSQAFRNKLERFVGGAPKLAVLPDAVWINPPTPPTDRANLAVTIYSGAILE